MVVCIDNSVLVNVQWLICEFVGEFYNFCNVVHGLSYTSHDYIDVIIAYLAVSVPVKDNKNIKREVFQVFERQIVARFRISYIFVVDYAVFIDVKRVFGQEFSEHFYLLDVVHGLLYAICDKVHVFLCHTPVSVLVEYIERPCGQVIEIFKCQGVAFLSVFVVVCIDNSVLVNVQWLIICQQLCEFDDFLDSFPYLVTYKHNIHRVHEAVALEEDFVCFGIDGAGFCNAALLVEIITEYEEKLPIS